MAARVMRTQARASATGSSADTSKRPFSTRVRAKAPKRAAFKPLLTFHVLVAGKKNVETLPLFQRQQRAVFSTAPLHTDDGVNLMPGQRTRQLARHALIEENLQGCA
jgi:hypothetical protein